MAVESSGYLARRAPVANRSAGQSAEVDCNQSTPRKSCYVGRRAASTVASNVSCGSAPEGNDRARRSQYISRRLCPESRVLGGLNVVEFPEDSENLSTTTNSASVERRGSIHGDGNRVVCTVFDMAKSLAQLTDGQSDIAPSETVFLNIYDLGDTSAIQNLNVILKPLGSGAFHAAVQVYGQEWSFGGLSADSDDQGDETGIWSCRPQMCKQHSFRESIPVGTTCLSHIDVLTVLGEIADDWPMNSYDLLRRNCCHFCDEFCRLLGLGPLPDWVLNLANVGAALDDSLARMARKIRMAMSAANKLNRVRLKNQCCECCEGWGRLSSFLGRSMLEPYATHRLIRMTIK